MLADLVARQVGWGWLVTSWIARPDRVVPSCSAGCWCLGWSLNWSRDGNWNRSRNSGRGLGSYLAKTLVVTLVVTLGESLRGSSGWSLRLSLNLNSRTWNVHLGSIVVPWIPRNLRISVRERVTHWVWNEVVPPVLAFVSLMYSRIYDKTYEVVPRRRNSWVLVAITATWSWLAMVSVLYANTKGVVRLTDLSEP